MTLRRNVLIVHLGALGDFVLTWPLAMALGRIHPQSRIIYVTNAQKGALAEKALGVEWTDIELGWHHLYGDAGQLPDAARKLLAGAHSIYSFIANDRDRWAEQARTFSGGADVCCLRPTPDGGHASHAADWIIEQLRARPAVAEAMRQMVRSVASRGLVQPAQGAGPVAIHPGSGSPGKCWPAERYLELAERFRAAGRPVKVILGDVERERWPEQRIRSFERCAELCAPGTLVELWACLLAAGRYVGNDSGPSHLAGMMGLDTVCLFGPSDPAVWRPLGPRVRVIRSRVLDELAVEEVWRQL